jgi:diguanylate cyclase (GGDEF)-like protein
LKGVLSRKHPVRHRRAYAAAASLLSLAAPAGFLILEGALARRIPTGGWALARISSQPEIYGYLFLFSLGALAALGFLLGKKQDLLETAWTDELTGLASRRLFVVRLREEVRRSHRTKTPLALLLIDVDKLKDINDRGGGHEMGDLALRAVARSLEATCRETDLAARFGGDEFAVVAPLADALHGMELAARIRRSLAAVRIGSGSSSLSLTVSIGIADLEHSFEASPEALCEEADQALYLAKAHGRDCAVVAPRSTRSGPPPAGPASEAANDSVRRASGQ